MPVTRRRFLQGAALVAAGMGGLRRVLQATAGSLSVTRFGPLRPDPQAVLDLPEGFAYRVFSRTGETMDDGLLVPCAHDGMGAFLGDGGLTVLVRNHEWKTRYQGQGPFGPDYEKLDLIPADRVYDLGDGAPCEGGTTNLVFDTRSGRLIRHFLSLAGTAVNCGGGPTPWGTWITCEEMYSPRMGSMTRDHGFAFEVPARATPGLQVPAPLEAMGRFARESVAVDPRTGIVYQTEDEPDGLITRFLPDEPGTLIRGGRLQALCVTGTGGYDTRNWPNSPVTEPGVPHPVGWVDLDDVRALDTPLRTRGLAGGAAVFARGEGMWFGNGSVYFACTSGGRNGHGQIWRYTPGEHEGTPAENNGPGRLELFVEPNDVSLLDFCDSLTVAPWGDLVVCEDGSGDQFLLGITPEGGIYRIARNAMNESEFAGATFSPDGTTLFVNIQNPGLTLALTGPWRA